MKFVCISIIGPLEVLQMHKCMYNDAPPYFEQILFLYAQTLQTKSKGCCIRNSSVFGSLFHENQKRTKVLPYISLCKMKCPLWGHFIFMRKFYKPSFTNKGCCICNSFVFGLFVFPYTFV